MLKITNVKLKQRASVGELTEIVSVLLGISQTDVLGVQILKLSLDARKKSNVQFIYTLLVVVKDENIILSPSGGRISRASNAVTVGNVTVFNPTEDYTFPVGRQLPSPPVIVGMGPAGPFAGLCLARSGVKCIILERGEAVEDRIRTVEAFWKDGLLNKESNVQFGEGGAGTFSDGKLTTGVNDRRIRFVLDELVKFGAPGDISYLAKPHIGTDRLRDVVTCMRKELIELGCEILFGNKLIDLSISDGRLSSITVQNSERTYSIDTRHLILAPGNSSRDTFKMLHDRCVRLSGKAFSIGVRIEHLQSDMDMNQYGQQAISSAADYPASDYKLAVHLEGGRSVYTFCVCPGGQVVAAASEDGKLVTNGMSHYARDGENINGALLVSITPEDYGNSPLGGMYLQSDLETRAFDAGGGNYHAPAQLVGDFLQKKPSTGYKKITPTYMPGVKFVNLWDVLPEFVCQAIVQALPELSKRVGVFGDKDAIMTAVETRSSSPVRIDRENYQSVNVKGLYPCGEGAGYAGGIMSAAVDGIKTAEAVVSFVKDEN